MNYFFRNELMPKSIFIPFAFAKLWLTLLQILRPRKFVASSKTLICIEAGSKGWDSIEFQELYQSACEYLDDQKVIKAVITDRSQYVAQVREILKRRCISHYVYDPRTGSQHWLIGCLQSLQIASILQWNNITPIVLLSDFSIRSWRAQSAIISANNGVVVTFMSPRLAQPIFPHKRIVGPCLMPLSLRTFQSFQLLRCNQPKAKATFVGSLYEPRTTMLRQIQSGLANKGFLLEIQGRKPGAARIPDEEYWKRLVNSAVVITTASQIEIRGSDWTWIPQLVYRYIEAIASGALLVAPEVPGVQRFFKPGVHFASFDSVDKAVDVISFYLENSREREKIANQGQQHAQMLISSRVFWMGIDTSLGKNGLY